MMQRGRFRLSLSQRFFQPFYNTLARPALKIAWVVIVLALLSVVAFVLARASGQI
jgi:hypothetical protein